MANMFKKASKAQARLRMAICGPAGAGKTYTALAIATNMGSNVALIDTERGSASKYSDKFDFSTLSLETFHPQLFMDAIKNAEEGGFDVIVIDSMSHAWAGKGGVLDVADRIAKQNKSANSFTAWKEATPLQQALMDSILQCKCHIIVTMRSKMEYVLEAVERGGRTVQQPKRVGMAPVQRDDVQYEFDVVGEMDDQNSMVIVKTRCSALAGEVIRKPGEALAKTLIGWLTDGKKVEPKVECPQPVAPAGEYPQIPSEEDYKANELPPEGNITPLYPDPNAGALEGQPNEMDLLPANSFWSSKVAADVRKAQDAVAARLAAANPESESFGDAHVKSWLKGKYGITSRKQATEPMVNALKDWLRECFKAGKMVA